MISVKIVLLLVVFFPDTLWVSGKFIRSTQTGEEKEVIKGKFYSIPGKSLTFEVDSPIHQFMTFKGETLVLYYPEDSVAFKIKSSLAFMQDGMQFAGQRFGKKLKESGFLFLKREIKGDTITSFWTHSQLKNIVELQIYKQRMVGFRIKDEKGNTILILKVGNYIQLTDSLYFPDYIETVGLSTREEIKFQDLKIGNVPPFIKKFHIPERVKVIEKGWED